MTMWIPKCWSSSIGRLLCTGAAASALLLTAPAIAVDESDLLPTSMAFEIYAVRAPDHQVYVTFTIAPGYALYRDRIRIVGAPGAVTWVRLPHGEVVQDAYLGSREEWRYRAIAMIGLDKAPGPVHLQVSLQGCADLGVCFNPETRAVTVN